MEMPKPSEEDKARFRALVPDAPGVEVKPMFGNLGGFVNGNMFMGLFGSSIGVKLPEADAEALLQNPGAGPFGPPDRPMGRYVALPEIGDPAAATPWIEKALAHVGALPPKQKKPKKK